MLEIASFFATEDDLNLAFMEVRSSEDWGGFPMKNTIGAINTAGVSFLLANIYSP